MHVKFPARYRKSFVALLVALLPCGCNTLEGVGRDLSRLGRGMETRGEGVCETCVGVGRDLQELAGGRTAKSEESARNPYR